MAITDSGLQDWPERYLTLLDDTGLSPDQVLADALPPQAPQPVPFLSLARCLEQPQKLRQKILSNHPEVSDSRTLRAHLSVLQQDLALSVLAPLTLELFCLGRTRLPDPETIFLGQDQGRICGWFQEPIGGTVDTREFVAATSQLVRGWYPVFRKELGLSPGAYWSSIGLGLGAPFSAIWNRGGAHAICGMAQQWLQTFDCEAEAFIDWIPASFQDRLCAIPQRRGCCLKYLLPGGGYCGTCGIHRKSRMGKLSPPGRNQAPGRRQSVQ